MSIASNIVLAAVPRKPPVTVPVMFVNALLSHIPSNSQVLANSLQRAGIDPSLLMNERARVTSNQLEQLLGSAIKRGGDEGLGFFERPLRLGSLRLIASSCLEESNVSNALQRCCTTFNLLQDRVLAKRIRRGRLEGLRLVIRSGHVAPYILDELLLRALVRLISWLQGNTLRATRYELRRPLPAYAHEYKTIFPGVLQFDTYRTTAWFNAETLAGPVRRDRTALARFMRHMPGNIVIPRRSQYKTIEAVRDFLFQSYPQWPNLKTVAVKFNVSSSTLQRRLGAEGASFQILKDDLRRDMAIQCLTTTQSKLYVVAQDLGFSDSATFQRAFKQWTGIAPGKYRAQARYVRRRE